MKIAASIAWFYIKCGHLEKRGAPCFYAVSLQLYSNFQKFVVNNHDRVVMHQLLFLDMPAKVIGPICTSTIHSWLIDQQGANICICSLLALS